MSSTITKNAHIDHVGSLLRPQALKEAYARHGNGEILDSELTRVEDESVKALIAKQEAHGLSILTDGEYRHLNFQDSFVESVSGFIPKKQTMQFQESCTVGGEALQRWQPDSGKPDPALQYWRSIADAKRDYPAKAQRREGKRIMSFRPKREIFLRSLASTRDDGPRPVT